MNIENYKISEYISDFLDFLSATTEQLSISENVLEESNNELCDLEHAVELLKLDCVKRVKLVQRLEVTRKKRRDAKNMIDTCQPIVDWQIANKQIINSLRQLLGDVRKTERRQASRTYTVRTKILDGIYDDPHI